MTAHVLAPATTTPAVQEVARRMADLLGTDVRRGRR